MHARNEPQPVDVICQQYKDGRQGFGEDIHLCVFDTMIQSEFVGL